MKILYITTIGETMGFFREIIKKLIENGETVDIATNENDGKTPIQPCYREWGCQIYHLDTSRSPISFGNIRAINQIRKLVTHNHYDIVHCHTPLAAAATRLACKDQRKNGLRVIYTAHGFHFYKGAPFKNWLIYYPIEKLLSRYTDVLITINHEDYQIATKKFQAKKVVYVPGVGIDTQKFTSKKSDATNIRRDLGISSNEVLLFSVGELNINKNHSVVIRALKNTDSKVHYAIAGKGELKGYLENIARRCGVSNRVHLLGFRNDIPNLYEAADICVFPSIREGLPLAAIEGMASGLPLIVSDNRGTRGLIGDENGITCKYDDVNAFSNAINILARDIYLRHKLGDKNRECVDAFDFKIVNEIMMQIYNDRSTSG